MTTAINNRQAAHELLNTLPEDVSWDEIAYRVAVRASIEQGLADSLAGRTIPHEQVLKEFGIKG